MGARPGGMGDAYITLGDDALSVYHNPAGLIALEGISSEMFFGWEGFPLVENWGMLYAKSLSGSERFGMGVIRMEQDLDNKHYRSYQFILPSVRPISNRLITGLNLKLVTQKQDAASYKYKLTVDIGILYDRKFIKLGLMARNFIAPGMRSFPLNYNIGGAIDLGIVRIEADKVAGEWDEFTLEEDNFRLGAELNPSRFLSFRAGWDKTQEPELVSMGLGVSNQLQTMKLDYCYRTDKDDFSTGTHWLSYGYLAR